MKDSLPSPDFDSRQYARPNQKWVCGWACDGLQCMAGPDAKGRCRATFECKPVPEKMEGDKVLRWRCTRTDAQGKYIPCEAGPRPDGTCCRSIPKCQPVRSLRARRRSFTIALASLTIGLLLMLFYSKARWKFVAPGNTSQAHSGIKFTSLARSTRFGDENCGACHAAGQAGPVGWVQAALASDPKPFEFQKLLAGPRPTMHKIDAACRNCHTGHDFHQPNVVWDYSCSTCHVEHKGNIPLKEVLTANCIVCHGDNGVMSASAAKAKTNLLADFSFQIDSHRRAFVVAHSAERTGKTIHSFAIDHPEFQVVAEGAKDPDTLRFSHHTHMASNPQMPSVDGKKLDCAFCHQPDATGAYYGKVSFEKNCQVCHSLHFDKDNPDLTIPHGNAEAVHNFLRSLKSQYADYGRRVKKITGDKELKRFVEAADRRLRETYRTPDLLEEKVFFSTENVAPEIEVGRLGAKGRSLYPGCAYCHEVKATAAVPAVTAPVFIERWLNRGRFNHAKHTSVDCAACHQVGESKEASDVLLPSKTICASCHNPQVGIRNDCLMCHNYHNKRPGAMQVNGQNSGEMAAK